MRKLLVVILALLSCGIAANMGRVTPVAHGAVTAKKTCKTVTKKVHGKKKKVKVCSPVKAAPTATATPTAAPTNTPAPTPTNTSVSTTPAIDPARFALTAADVPSNVSITKSQIEPNAAADADPAILHFGSTPWEQQGRLTGYFWGASASILDTSGVAHTTIISYHVSIFGTSQQAAAAWQSQRTGWVSQDSTGGACGGSGAVGEAGFTCADGSVSSSGALVENYFKRGRLLIQVWGYATSDDFNNFFSSVVVPSVGIARQVAVTLDARAGATPGNSLALTRRLTPAADRTFERWLRGEFRQQRGSST